MSRRYQLARLAATLESVPELRDRLVALGERFESIRPAEENEPQRAIAQVFNTFYGTAVQQLDRLEQPGVTPRPGQLVAVEETIIRAEGILSEYQRTLGTGGSRSASSSSGSNGTVVLLLVGAVLLGGVLFMSRDRDSDF